MCIEWQIKLSPETHLMDVWSNKLLPSWSMFNDLFIFELKKLEEIEKNCARRFDWKHLAVEFSVCSVSVFKTFFFSLFIFLFIVHYTTFAIDWLTLQSSTTTTISNSNRDLANKCFSLIFFKKRKFLFFMSGKSVWCLLISTKCPLQAQLIVKWIVLHLTDQRFFLLNEFHGKFTTPTQNTNKSETPA